jgi:hypothetical protein
MLRKHLILILPILFLGACQGDTSPPDGGTLGDAGVSDAGTPDSGRQTIGANACGCTGLQSCDAEFLDCIEPEVCEEDEDCRNDRICVRGGCYDCWGDEMASCVGNQICGSEGLCQSSAVCEEDWDCVDGLTCGEDRSCGPPSPCDDDELEPNNRPLEARRIGGVRKGLWTCGAGDWYKVRLRKRAIMLRLRAAGAPIDPVNMPLLTLYDANARRVLGVGSLEGGRIVAALLGEPIGDDLLVHIMSPEPLRYDLAVQHLDDFCPSIDAEPNHNPDLALPLALGSPINGSLCPVAGDDEDLDLYSLQAANGQGIGFMLEQGGAEEVFISLRDASGRLLGEETRLTERFSRGLLGRAIADDRLFVGLRGSGSAYSLRVGLFAPSGDCEDDSAEPDDQTDFATMLGNSAKEGILCPSNLDHFAFDAQGDDGIHLSVQELEGQGSAWALRAPSGQNFALRRSGAVLRLDRERLGQPGRYLLVGAGGVTRSSYRVELELVAGGACTPDNFDPADDEREGANSLRLNRSSNIYSACSDADWFSMTLPAGPGRVRLRRFSNSEAVISMELFATGAELPLASTSVAGTGGDLEYDLPNGGDYLLRVLGDAHSTSRYQIMPVGPPPSNDTCANPGAIRLNRNQTLEILGSTEGAHHNAQSSCGGALSGDVHYFVQVPEGGGLVRFDLTTLPNESGLRSDHLLSLSRLCGAASELLCDDDARAQYQDRIEVDLDAGIYTLSVDSMSSFSGGSPFRLEASIGAADERLPFVAAGDGCGAEMAEIPLPENERGSITIASNSEGLSDSARGSCGFTLEGRDAFFAFTLSAPAQVRAAVPYGGRSSIYLRTASCTLPVDLACSFLWRGNQDVALGSLPTGRYVLIYDRMSELDGPFTLSLTLSDP